MLAVQKKVTFYRRFVGLSENKPEIKESFSFNLRYNNLIILFLMFLLNILLYLTGLIVMYSQCARLSLFSL